MTDACALSASSLWTTLLFAAVCVSAEMVLGIALALALERPVRGTAFFRTLFILPMMIAPIAVGLVWRYIFDAQFGLINALLALLKIGPIGLAGRPNIGLHCHRHCRYSAVDSICLHYDGGGSGECGQCGD